MQHLFRVATFLGAGLLFLIQPYFARLLLPQLGGAPSVWNTAMVFYQSLLLAGYALAHYLSRTRSQRTSVAIHALVMGWAAVNLPPGLEGIAPPGAGEPPIGWVLKALFLGVGPLFLGLATISPLLQHWFSRLPETRDSNPYHLYSAGNLGSLCALAAYPLILEPFLDLRSQSMVYTAVYLLFFFCLVWIQATYWIQTPSMQASSASPSDASPDPEGPRKESTAEWILLSFAPSSLMLGVTTYITTDLASVPLLWIVPLGLYLSTFIIAFAQREWIPHSRLLRGYPLVACPFLLALATGSSEPMSLLLFIHLLHFWWVSLMCHMRLVSKRPHASRLTGFYLCISIGGALGGTFNAILAPLLFPGLWEYPIAVGCAMWCGYKPLKSSLNPLRLSGWDWSCAAAFLLVMACLVGGAPLLRLQSDHLMRLLLFGIPIIVGYYHSEKHGRFALLGACILLAGHFWVGEKGRVLYQTRTFFGVHRISIDPSGRFIQLLHGQTIHGWQSLSPSGNQIPLTYFHPSGPFGQIIEKTSAVDLKKAGVVGLGAGSLAAYGKKGQEWTFYEIDPEVVRIACDSRYFDFVDQSEATIRFVTGDARLTLQNAEPGSFDLLVLDAYSSDSIPVHLLTLEAVTCYSRVLNSNGILAFHLSNRNLDLERVLAAITRELGWVARIHDEIHITSREYELGKKDSKWVVLSPSIDNLRHLPGDSRWHPLMPGDDSVLWTDHHSSVLRALNWF